ncbi:MAG: AMIN domain-containing protein, partial [Steroidobacteraceae bacterium]
MAGMYQANDTSGLWRGALLAFCLAAAASGVHAQEAGNRLVSVEVKPLSGTSVQVRLNTTAPAPTPVSFTIDRPARLAIDLADVELALDERRVDVGAAGLESVVAAQAGGRTRLVFNLAALLPYTAVAQGNSVIVTLGEDQALPQPLVSQPAEVEPASAAPRSLRGVDFRRSSDGSGRVIVRLSDKTQSASLRQEGNTVIVDFAGSSLPDDLLKRYDVMDFATPVSTVEVMRNASGAQVRIAASGDFEQLAYQTDDTYVVEIKERPQQSAVSEAEKVYTGERLTLNFQDIDVRAVLQLLADTSGQNIVVSDSVSGRVTLRLQNVPWDQALDIVLRTRGLGMRTKDNVILVAPQDELAARERAELEALNAIEELVPLRTEFLQVNYAKAGTLSGLLSSAGGGSLLSDRGNVSVDERTNTLIVQDTADRLEEIRAMVAALDIPVRQVLIESRIVIVSD